MNHSTLRGTVLLSALATLAACSADPVGPDASLASASPRALVAPGEFYGFTADSTDAAGNTILIQEMAAGVYDTPDGQSGSVASVTVRTFIPASGAGSSSYCITNSIVRTETTPGNTLTVKKAGGCGKDIEVLIEQKATKKKATFRFSMVPGKTVIDAGALR